MATAATDSATARAGGRSSAARRVEARAAHHSAHSTDAHSSAETGRNQLNR